MATEVIMPSLGEGVVEGTLMRWLKQPGESVNEMEPLLEVNTDKVDTEIPSPADGTVLEVRAAEGQVVKVGQVLAVIGDKAEAPADGPAPVEKSSTAQGNGKSVPAVENDRATRPVRTQELGFISPVVARIAGEHQIDLRQVKGTGLSGRITKKDVLNYVGNRSRETQIEVDRAQVVEHDMPVAEPQVKPVPSAPIAKPASPQAPLPVFPGEGEVMPLTPVRRAIAEHMVMSKHTSPHVTTVMEVDLSKMMAHREGNKSAFAKDGVRLTFTPYFISAIVRAIKDYPLANSSWTDEGIRIHRSINIGMATSLEADGLIVPVIKNADSFSLLGLARTVNDLAERARNRKLTPDEVRGGTFTITNHGISGSLFATPIINQPQCGILGVGAIQKRVVVLPESDAIAVRPMAYISLTFDHRILDGATADHFLMKVVEYLQNWA